MVEWGRKIEGKVEEVFFDRELEISLPDKRKVYLLTYKVEEPLLPWMRPDPETFVEAVKKSLKEQVGLLGEDFLVHWYRYDEERKFFYIQIERVPPVIRPAAASIGIITVALCATIIATVVFAYFTFRLVAQKADKIIPFISEAGKKLKEILVQIGKTSLTVGGVFIAGVIVYYMGKVVSARLTKGG